MEYYGQVVNVDQKKLVMDPASWSLQSVVKLDFVSQVFLAIIIMKWDIVYNNMKWIFYNLFN